MNCTSCDASNRPGRKFCSSCGTALSAVCRVCSTPYEPDERFCGECGSALTGGGPGPASAAASTAEPQRDGELRQVTVLFCDLVGFTTLSEVQDAEDTRELLSGYFDVARRVIDRYGGTIEKFIGDAVMAVWGTPVAHEDDADRAVRAALELVTEVERFGESRGVGELRARAGVVTGQAASWSNAGEGLVVGDRVNTAARVQSTADPGTVYVDDVTKHVTVASIAYSDAGVHQVKGKAEPLQLWRAVRVVAAKGGAQRIDGLEGAFVGRSRELNLVKELFHSTVEDGRARLVSVTGQAGVGKSRLRWEFFKYVEGLAFDVWWHSGRCLSYGDGVAYWALSEMVRQRLGIAEEDADDVAAGKLGAGLERYVHDPTARDYVRPAIGTLVGVGDATIPREELFAGWRMFLEQLAAVQPVVMVFEDMQWADGGLLDFVEQLLDWSMTHPIFMLSFARPDLTERRPEWAAQRRNATPLYLDALPDTAMSQLLDDLVPGLPVDVSSKITTRAAGIPLYAVEMVRGLIDRDVVVPQGGVYKLVGTVEDLDLPASLTALIGARLDALSPDDRAAVRTMSVLGGSFPRAAVVAVTDLDAGRLDTVLQSLLRKEILTVHSDPLSPERGQYAFAQTLMRSVAYDTLSKRERKTLHQQVAEHLRSVFPGDGEDVVEVIASHYRDAYEAGASDPDAESLRAEALAMFIRAARRAAAVGAPESAEQAYRVAAGLAVDHATVAELSEAAGDMAYLAGRYAEAYELFERARAAHLDNGHDRDALLLTTKSAKTLGRRGQLVEAEELLRAGIAQMPPDDPGLAGMVAALARTLIFLGQIPEALERVEQALVLAQDFEDNDALTLAVTVKALLLSLGGRNTEALILFGAALELLRDQPHPELQMNTHGNMADLLQQSDLDGVDEHTDAVLELAARVGDRNAYAFTVFNRIGRQLLKGGWDDAEHAAHEILETSGGLAEARFVHLHVAALAALRGDVPSAAHEIEEVAQLADSDDVQDRTLYRATAALVALAGDRFDEAAEQGMASAIETLEGLGVRTESLRLAWPTAAEAALKAGRTQDFDDLLALLSERPIGQVPPYLRAQLARLEALGAAARGEHTDVEAGLVRAIEILEGLGYVYWLAVVRADLAEWLLQQGRSADAAPLLDLAAAEFDRLRAAPQQARISAIRTHVTTPVEQTQGA